MRAVMTEDFNLEYNGDDIKDIMGVSLTITMSREELLKAVKSGEISLRFVSDEFQTKEICMAAVTANGRSLRWVHEPHRHDPEICIAAVQQDGFALGLVPKDISGYREIALEAVRSNGRCLCQVPDEIIDREICEEAVKQCGSIIMHVPEGMLDKDMCMTAAFSAVNKGRLITRALRSSALSCMPAEYSSEIGRFIPEETTDTYAFAKDYPLPDPLRFLS